MIKAPRTFGCVVIVIALMTMSGCGIEHSNSHSADGTQQLPAPSETPVIYQKNLVVEQMKWTLVAVGSENSKFYVGDVKRDGQFLVTWEKVESCDVGRASHVQYDCPKSLRRARSPYHNSDGVLIEDEWGEWNVVVPNSIGEKVLRWVCSTPAATD